MSSLTKLYDRGGTYRGNTRQDIYSNENHLDKEKLSVTYRGNNRQNIYSNENDLNKKKYITEEGARQNKCINGETSRQRKGRKEMGP